MRNVGAGLGMVEGGRDRNLEEEENGGDRCAEDSAKHRRRSDLNVIPRFRTSCRLQVSQSQFNFKRKAIRKSNKTNGTSGPTSALC